MRLRAGSTGQHGRGDARAGGERGGEVAPLRQVGLETRDQGDQARLELGRRRRRSPCARRAPRPRRRPDSGRPASAHGSPVAISRSVSDSRRRAGRTRAPTPNGVPGASCSTVMPGATANVDQARRRRAATRRHAEVGLAGDRAGDRGAGREALRHLGPRVGLRAPARQRDRPLGAGGLEDLDLDVSPTLTSWVGRTPKRCDSSVAWIMPSTPPRSRRSRTRGYT